MICWIESVDPVADVSGKPNLFSTVDAFEFKKITEVQNAHRCKDPTPPCALAKILPDTTVRA